MDDIKKTLQEEREQYMYRETKKEMRITPGLRLVCEYSFPDFSQAVCINTDSGLKVFWIDEFRYIESDM